MLCPRALEPGDTTDLSLVCISPVRIKIFTDNYTTPSQHGITHVCHHRYSVSVLFISMVAFLPLNDRWSQTCVLSLCACLCILSMCVSCLCVRVSSICVPVSCLCVCLVCVFVSCLCVYLVYLGRSMRVYPLAGCT